MRYSMIHSPHANQQPSRTKRVYGSAEGSEIRFPSNASSNGIHERPAASLEVEDMTRSSEKSEREDKEPLKDIG